MVKPRVFMNFMVGDAPAGRVIFELFNDTAPKTAENFRALCTGEKGVSPISDVPLYYKGCTVHRAIKDFMIQAGDFTKGNGAGGESIYGAPFPDEDLERPIDSEGLLVMANRGPDTNSSQFFVTVRPCPHLDGKHVCFGRVVAGYDVIEKISNVETDGKDRPLEKVLIASCGELEFRKVPPKPVADREASAEASEEESPPPKGKRRHRGEDSDEDDSEEEERKRRKRERKARKQEKRDRREKERSKRDEVVPSKPDPAVPHQETEEEYDARLEREEQERINEIRRKELEALKREKEDTSVVIDGVRYKGRGAMKYRDPESSFRQK
ncbi:hypothetical protein CALCODRAFT_260117 [Calocera cornea HHB12733]|uniref:peptidylprolyl isomerase n=1 Tax=Calocera cornea HHB12733 TaxID=1353952 RepID=A0A165GI37_9BASI|nr:hypothetical protein CALCODRAFT_260117 [Calocera cornea HHB12733]